MVYKSLNESFYLKLKASSKHYPLPLVLTNVHYEIKKDKASEKQSHCLSLTLSLVSVFLFFRPRCIVAIPRDLHDIAMFTMVRGLTSSSLDI